jgi:glycosyltransferase involved in cell wall biosynthesis
MSSILAVCADPGIPLDGVKGASIHVLELWRALAESGAVVRGVAGVRDPGRVPVVPGVSIRAVPLEAARRDGGFSSAVSAAAGELVADPSLPRPRWILERLALGSEVGARMADDLGLPLVVEVNAPLDEEAARFRGVRRGRAARLSLERTLSRADVIVCVSSALVPWVLARGGSKSAARVLPNGVRVDAFGGPRPVPAAGAPLSIAFVGSFKPWHGLDVLLDAFLALRLSGVNAALDLVGDGPERDRLAHRVESAGCEDRVRFHGARPHAAIVEVLRCADVGVAPAPKDVPPYFSPLKVYEYAAAGCAIVAPSVGQTAERFRDGEDALLVPPGDAPALARALRRLAADRPLRHRLAEAARRRARLEFDWSHVASRLHRWVGEARSSLRSGA